MNQRISYSIWLLIFICVINIQGVYSQSYRIEISTITDQSGAPPSATFAIIEDRQGFIWFGTIDGLYRYDGFNYKIFRNNAKNTNSLSNNTIRDLAIDKNGVIWIATQGGGIDAFDPKTEAFKNFKHTGLVQNEISGNNIWSVLVDKSNNIWLGVTGEGLDKINQQDNTIQHYSILASGGKLSQEQSIRSLLEDDYGNIWAGISNQGIASLDPKTGHVKQIDHIYNNRNSLTNDQPFDLHLGHDGKIWIATFGGGINIYNPINNSFEHLLYDESEHSIISNLTYSITERIRGEYWIATEYGISIYNIDDNTTRNFQQSSRTESISENRIRTVFIDSKGIIWAGTESGVEKFVSQSNFKFYSNQFESNNEVNKSIVKAIATEDDYLWIGLIDNGLLRYSFKEKKYKKYLNPSEIISGLSGSNINSILIDSKNNLWIAEWYTGLLKYNKLHDRFDIISNAYHENNRLSDNRVQRIIEGKPGILWITTEGGLNRYDIMNDKFTQYLYDPNDSNSLSSNSLQSQAIVFDKDSNLWIGTWSFGLNKMEFKDPNQLTADFIHYRNNPEDNSSLPNDNVISLLYDTTHMWIGTFGGGLCKFNFETQKFKTYTTANGLPNNIVFAIFKDKNRNLWLSTDYGISMFNPDTETFQNYTKLDGLQDNHFFWGAAHKNKDGHFYFGGINGVNSFIPEKVKPDTAQAPPVIIDIKLFNKSINQNKLIIDNKKVKFQYKENFITIDFVALDYSEPDKNYYKYQLKGFDKDWIASKGRGSASYTNLSPGQYTFRLQVSNSDGHWNKEIVELAVHIIPPWWNTWLARITLILLITSVILVLYKIRVKVLTRQKKELEKQVRFRTTEIEQKGKELNQQKTDISSKNILLNAQKNELSDRNNELRKTLEELENTQKALIESEKLASVGILTAGVAHEINNPLNFISVGIENIKALISEIQAAKCVAKSEDFKDIFELITHAETGVKRISNIVGSLKTLVNSSVEENEIIKPEELLDLSTIFLSHMVPSYIKITKSFNTQAYINVKKHRLSQVFINILENAIHAINDKPEKTNESIEIHVKQEKRKNIEYVLFEIANSGKPLQDEVLKNMFNPFFTTKAPNKGTGLGLYITYSIIQEHNGLIAARNKNGKVIFSIFVPVCDNLT